MLGVALRPLDRWLQDPLTEEIAVNRPDEVFVMQEGCWQRHTVDLSYRQLYGAAVLSGALSRQNVSELSPLVEGDMPGELRFCYVVPPCVPTGTVSLTLRKPGTFVAPLSTVTQRYETGRWNKFGGLAEVRARKYRALLAQYDSGDVEGFLDDAIRDRLNVYLTGATGAGKTSMGKTLAQVISPDERIITVENARELVVPQQNSVRLTYTKGSRIGPIHLLQACLRMRPDRILVSELRDSEEAWAYVRSITTGHPGSLTTLHGGSAAEAFLTLVNLAKGSAEGRSFDTPTLKTMLAQSIDVIAPFEKVGNRYHLREVWFRGEAERRGKTATELLGD
jgi:type IV secretion system protein VirB11